MPNMGETLRTVLLHFFPHWKKLANPDYNCPTSNCVKSKTTRKQQNKETPAPIDFDSKHDDRTPIGKDHQAAIPDFLHHPPYPSHETPYKGLDTLVWDGYALSEKEADKYLSAVVKKKERNHRGTADDEEVALFNLHRARYNVDEAKRRYGHKLGSTPLRDIWSLEDRDLFKVELKRHGKDFHAIQQAIYWKSTCEIVDYYYSHKRLGRARH